MTDPRDHLSEADRALVASLRSSYDEHAPLVARPVTGRSARSARTPSPRRRVALVAAVAVAAAAVPLTAALLLGDDGLGGSPDTPGVADVAGAPTDGPGDPVEAEPEGSVLPAVETPAASYPVCRASDIRVSFDRPDQRDRSRLSQLVTLTSTADRVCGLPRPVGLATLDAAGDAVEVRGGLLDTGPVPVLTPGGAVVLSLAGRDCADARGRLRVSVPGSRPVVFDDALAASCGTVREDWLFETSSDPDGGLYRLRAEILGEDETVRAGEFLPLTVAVTNPTGAPVALGRCPGVLLLASAGEARISTTCRRGVVLQPGETRRFRTSVGTVRSRVGYTMNVGVSGARAGVIKVGVAPTAD